MLPLILILLALVLWLLSRRTHEAAGLPAGEVAYSDTGGWGRVDRPLFSQRLQLAGKPDYLVREGGAYIPVEVKSGRAPKDGPHASHVFQLAAYCALVTEAYRSRPAYGMVKYADQTLRVDYTPELEAGLNDLLTEIRAAEAADDMLRSHSSAARCRACGFRDECGEALG